MKITYRQLKAKGACADQLAKFKSLFGKEVTLSLELCLQHASIFDFYWAAMNFLSDSDYEEYRKASAPAHAEYEKVRAPAYAEYRKVSDSARAEYEKAIAPAYAEYRKAIALARAEYEKVRVPAYAEYEKVRATAFYNIAVKG